MQSFGWYNLSYTQTDHMDYQNCCPFSTVPGMPAFQLLTPLAITITSTSGTGEGGGLYHEINNGSLTRSTYAKTPCVI